MSFAANLVFTDTAFDLTVAFPNVALLPYGCWDSQEQARLLLCPCVAQHSSHRGFNPLHRHSS